MNLTESIAPRSDQMNAEDLLTGPRTFTIAEVRAGNTEQPVEIVLAEFPKGRPWKPSKTQRRILVAAWGQESSAYIGRRVTLFRDPEITFGKDKVGGIRISHMSHIEKRISVALTVTRGKRAPFVIEPLPDSAPTSEPVSEVEVKIAALKREWKAADAERRAEIETEVAVLKNEPEVTP